MTTDDQGDSGQLLPQVDDSNPPVESSDAQAIENPNQSAQQGPPPSVQPPQQEEAGDVDIIEKAWIEKAKKIVDQTSSDPFEQQKMLSKVKADYIKKRFNKDIKINDE